MFAWSTFLTYAFITAITPGPNNENVLRPPEAAAVPPQHDSRAAL